MENNKKCFRIIIIEDDILRLRWFRQKFIGHVLSMTKDVEEAKRMFVEHEYDYIFLDHDLSEKHYSQGWSGNYEGEDKTTGYEVALFLESMPDIQPDAKIFVHTLSPSGSERMCKCLHKARRDYQRVPFHVLQEKLRIE